MQWLSAQIRLVHNGSINGDGIASFSALLRDIKSKLKVLSRAYLVCNIHCANIRTEISPCVSCGVF